MIRLQNVSKCYALPSGPFRALADIDVEIAAGEFVALVGKSGSGKSTLLNVIAGIDRPTGGEISVDGIWLTRSSERALTRWRGAAVGVVFQFFQLLPMLTALENVMLPMDFVGIVPARKRRTKALDLLARVAVVEQADKLPGTLSGGQQQRVAIARALANDPRVVTADEPTGNLDSEATASIVELFRALAVGGTTVVMATHERDLSGVASRTIALKDGRIAGPVGV